MVKPMLADKFFDSSQTKKNNSFEFEGSSGNFNNGKWTFSKTLTFYRTNPTGWYASEKKDGVRSIWLSKTNNFVSRTGKIYTSPVWLKDLLSSTNQPIDGELFGGVDTFASTSGLMRRNRVDGKDWSTITFEVFDIPQIKKPFRHRLKMLKTVVQKCNSRWSNIREKYPDEKLPLKSPLRMIPQVLVRNMKHVYKLYKRLVLQGSEGLMLRHPNSAYTPGKRSKHMLKWKPSPTAEGLVVGINEGKNRLKGKLGTFTVQLYTNRKTNPKKVFKVSGRMSDQFRGKYKFKNGKIYTHPKNKDDFPGLGDLITFEYMSFSKSGIPRQPIFVHKRHKTDL
jgi:DNA ligase-1